MHHSAPIDEGACVGEGVHMGVQLYAANGYNSTQVLPMRPARVVMMGSAVLRVLHRFTYVFRFLLALSFIFGTWYISAMLPWSMDSGRER